MKTPILETERLILRTFEKSDAEQVFFGWEKSTKSYSAAPANRKHS